MFKHKIRLWVFVSDLVGDHVELLLIFSLDVDGALDAGEVGDAGALDENGYLLAGHGDAGEDDGELGVDVPCLLLLEEPAGQCLELVALLPRLRLRRRPHRRAPDVIAGARVPTNATI